MESKRVTGCIWPKRTGLLSGMHDKTILAALVSVYLIGFLLSVFVYHPLETGGGFSRIQETVRCAAGRNFGALISLCSMTIIYGVTFLTALEFIWWRLGEWRKQTLLLERSRFAVKKHELIMRVDEDSRKRNHEMEHHMETLYALISAGGEIGGKRLYLSK